MSFWSLSENELFGAIALFWEN